MGQLGSKPAEIQYIEVRPDDHIVCLNISKTYKSKERTDIYDCVRHYWRLNVGRAEMTNLVFAIVDGIIVGVFQPIRWYKSNHPQYTNRFEFEGVEKECPFYLGRSVLNVLNPKSQNPVSYINL